MTASGSGIPLMTRNSSVLSSIAESEPPSLITGRTFAIWSSRYGDAIFSSRACILSAFPLMVLISPLWTMKRYGCALSQDGLVFVENLECTIVIADSKSSSCRSLKNVRSCPTRNIPL